MNTQIYKGNCNCENITVTIELPLSEELGAPRKCDCDFCLSYDVSYISNPKGLVHFEISDINKIKKLKQGSNTAFFLVCSHCNALISANYHVNEKTYCSINTNHLQNIDFPEPTIVSPRFLDKEQKTSRWQQLWFKSSITTRIGSI